MKIALCLYGNLRSFDNVFPSLHKCILEPFCPDIFSFIWNNTNEIAINKFDSNHPIWNIKNIPKNTKMISSNYVTSVIDKLNPIVALIEDYNSPSFQHNTDWKLPSALYKNLWAQSQCVKLKNEYEHKTRIQYDLVIMSRWDIYYENLLKLHHTDKIFFPEKFSIGAGGPSDFWAYGPSKLMNVFSDRFNHFQHFENNINQHPNKFLHQLLLHYNIEYQHTDVSVNLLNRNW